ncbi:MAG: acyl carrier protein [Candidatus Nanopelagicales bacterium]|nr:acyl carrier protein [Candidatus Nanopelagicales bacterium]
MDVARARHLVDQVVHLVAPGVDPGTLDPGAPLREQADLDALDVGEMAALLSDALHAPIPREDLHHLASIDSAVAYVAARLPDPR